MMRICFVTPYSPKVVGGIGTFLIEISKNLKKKGGVDSFVITRDVENPLETDIDIFELAIGNYRVFSGVSFISKMSYTIFKKRKEIDILHIQTPHHLTAPIAILGRAIGIPVVTTFHGKLPRGESFLRKNLSLFAESIVIHFSDALTFVSKESKGFYGNPSSVVILNGVDPNRFLRVAKEREITRQKLHLDNCFVILFLGRWVAHKGIYTLIDVFNKISKKTGSNLKLLLIGSGEEMEVKKRISLLGLEKTVLPVGKVEKVREYFNSADVFVLFTSPQEGLPIAILEAMACELPVVASNVSGIPEVIEHQKNGLLIKLNDVDDLTKKLLWCIDNPKLLSRLGEHARETIVSIHSIDKMTSSYIEIYKDLLKK